MENWVIYLIIGIVVILIVLGFLVFLIIKRKKQKNEINEEVSEGKTKSKEEVGKLISENTINDLLEEGKEQLELGNISKAKKNYKMILHEYDGLENKSTELYASITNFYKKLKDASKK